MDLSVDKDVDGTNGECGGDATDPGGEEGDSDDSAKGSLPLDRDDKELLEIVVVGPVECRLWELGEGGLILLEVLYMDAASADVEFFSTVEDKGGDDGEVGGEDALWKRLGKKKKCFPLLLWLRELLFLPLPAE